MKLILLTTLLTASLLISCNGDKDSGGDDPVPVVETPVINYSVANRFPHDITSFTEGFCVHEGKLFESTGYTDQLPQTRSLFGEVDLATGKIDKKAELDKQKYFGEGIVFFKDKVYQLTYKTRIGFVYDAKTFKQLSTFSFPSEEGWGMTTDSINLVMSDGSNNLTYLDPVTLKPVKTLAVEDANGPVEQINELEFIHGFIYANVYTTNLILKIDPSSGKVLGKLDLGSLVSEVKNKYPQSLEMNGIAYDPATDKVYITGKLWPNIYEIRFPH